MAKNNPITLAIPCYNAESFIGAVLHSVEKQTLSPTEILVVDDGSYDGSREIINKHPGVRLISHDQNYGIAAARNTAWENAIGNIVVYLDADTIAHPTLLEELVKFYNHSDIAGVGGRGLEIYQNSLYDRWRKEVLFQGWGEQFISDVPFLFGACSSFRRQFLSELGGFDPFFRISGEDMDFSFRARKAGFRLVYNPKALVFHLRTDDRQSIRQMTYRHCYWGFLAQRKNRCFDNKVSIAKSIRIFIRQFLFEGLVKGDINYAWMTILLHSTIMRAWIDSRQKNVSSPVGSRGKSSLLAWEGHRCSPVQDLTDVGCDSFDEIQFRDKFRMHDS
jgi:GT2 family glycosyltransferase